MSIILSDISYRYPNQEPLFEHIDLSVPPNRKISVIGDNGTGKSTLLKLAAGLLAPSSGTVQCSSQPYYIPQQVGAAGQSVAQALGVAEKIDALRSIYGGSGDQTDYDRLADDWDVEARCRSALDHWGLRDMEPDWPMDSLSGGEKCKVFFAGLSIHNPEIILLDEPTNHLDRSGREKLYGYIAGTKAAVMAVSHDVALLNLMETTCELSRGDIRAYGGDYDLYREQKENEDRALSQQISSGEAALRLARKKAQEVKERQEKRMSRGAKTTSGVPRIILGGRQDKGENSGARLSEKHSDIIDSGRRKLDELRQKQRPAAELKIDFENARLHEGKLLVAAAGVNFSYADKKPVWQAPLDLEVRSGERIHITGDNGSGKTTLIGLLTGELPPTEGEVKRSDFSYVYLDQQYSLVDKDVTVLEIAREYNSRNLQEHEIRMQLNRALFPQDAWDKSCLALSGGERMRLYLCCLMISNHVPDMFILDEPTNNLDLSSLAILADTVADYRGTLLVISHDRNFIDGIGVTRSIELTSGR